VKNRLPPGDKYNLRTIERALSVFKVFLAQNAPSEMTLNQLSQGVGLSPSTTFRLLHSLRASGFIEQNQENGRYRLGVACLALGDAFLKSNDLRQRAYAALMDLRDQCGETVHLAFREGGEVVYLDKLAGLHPIGLMSSRVGGRAPTHCTALGKALLSHLPEQELRALLAKMPLTRYTNKTITQVDQLLEELRQVRIQGFAIDNEEHEAGAGCIACPIFDHRGVVAAISVSGPVDRILKGRENLVRLIKETAREVSAQMGGRLLHGDG